MLRKGAIDAGIDQQAMGAMAAMVLTSGLRPGTGASVHALAQGLRDVVNRDPMEAAVATVLGGAYLFWVAERDVNPKCRTFLDALVFVSTCLNVGYAKVFARTETGKAIATVLMTFGPALAAKIFDAPAATGSQGRAA